MNLLSVLNRSLQQRRWRITEILTEFVEDELGGDLSVARPAFRRKHDFVVSLLGDQIQQLTTYQQ